VSCLLALLQPKARVNNSRHNVSGAWAHYCSNTLKWKLELVGSHQLSEANRTLAAILRDCGVKRLQEAYDETANTFVPTTNAVFHTGRDLGFLN
jgi:hypothetical protein